MACRVFLADDVPGIRELWRIFLEEAGIEVVGEAANGTEALRGVEATRPDVLVLDLSMPERDGLEVIPAVRTGSPGTAIVVASGFAASRMAAMALEFGADAYFEKGDPPEELVGVVRRVCDTAPARPGEC